MEWELDATGLSWRELEASLCFVDISGFTALSERLALRGRIGTEQLTEVLNEIFSRMLATAARQGGSLLKFGGDALLLLFFGVDHELRAARSAIDMRTALREAQRDQLASQRLNLRMSVGIHSGTVNLFMVGASHRELLICGPAASTTVRMEQTAEAGEIVITPATARALPSWAVGEAKGSGFLLRTRRIGSGGPGPLPRMPVCRSTVATYLPFGLRSYLGSAGLGSEHRLATVAFVRYQGVDDLLARNGPALTASALDEVVTCVQSAVDSEGVTFLGSDIDENGGKIILVAGVPTASDDGEGRMLRALRAIADCPLPLGLQIGVNRGHVFAGEIGDEFRRTFTVIGDTVNLAARLMSAAPRGVLLATAGVLDRSVTLFGTEALPPFHVKGKKVPVQAYCVGPPQGINLEVRSALALVGRQPESGQLESALSSAQAGSGRVALIEGDRGVGKSRLVDELRSRHRETFVLVLQGEPYGQGTPYLPFRRSLGKSFGISRDNLELAAKQLRDLAAALGPEQESLTSLIAPLFDIELPETPESAAIAPEFRRDRMADLLGELCDRVVDETLLLLVEDAHWFDEASSGLIERLAAKSHDRAWLVIVTRRPVPGGACPAVDETIDLRPLEEEPARELLDAATAAAPLRPHENDAIVERAGGNPLFLEELVRMARSGESAALPESLDAVANCAIDMLGPLARQILRRAAVLGHSFEARLLSEVLASEKLDFDDSARLLLSDYLVSSGDGRMRFRHAVLREAAYEALPYKHRRELHALAGRVIERRSQAESDRDAETLSLHFSRAQDWDKTWHYACRAGDLAKKAVAFGEVAIHLERAVEAARHLPGLNPAEVASVWRDLGEARVWLGYYRAADDAYRRSATIVADDPLAWAACIEMRARVVGEHERRYRSAIRILHRGLARLHETVGQEADAIVARLIASEAEIRSRQGRYEDALRLCRQVIDRAKPIGELRALAIAYSITDEALMLLGRIGEVRHLGLALEVYETLGDLQKVGATLRNLGAMAYFEGRWDDAVSLYCQAAQISLRAGDVAGVAASDANLGELFANQGRLEEAEAALRRAARICEGLGYATYEAFVVTQLGRVAAEAGSDSEALRLLSRAVEMDDSTGSALSGMEARGYLAEAHLLGGRPSEAMAVTASARAQAGQALNGTPAGVRLDRVEVTALAALGFHSGLVARIDDLISSARVAGSYFDLVLLLVLRGWIDGATETPAVAEERERLLSHLGIVGLPALSGVSSVQTSTGQSPVDVATPGR